MAIVVAALALLFTVVSFWWINARPGQLHLTEVRLFAAAVRKDAASLLRIPVVLYNTGAVPLVVTDLRMQAESAGQSAVVASKMHRSTIRPSSDDVEDFPRPYVVPGRSVVTKFVEFGIDSRLMVTGKPLAIEVEALIDRRGWRSVGRSSVRTDIIGDPGAYITYSNDPAHWPAGQQERAAAALSKLRAEMEASGRR